LKNTKCSLNVLPSTLLFFCKDALLFLQRCVASAPWGYAHSSQRLASRDRFRLPSNIPCHMPFY
jgi:hypothetical protein